MTTAASNQQDYLKGAEHIEAWKGVRIGIYSNKQRDVWHRIYHQGLEIKPYGNKKTLRIRCLDHYWTALFDLIDAPEMELEGPNQNRVLVKNPFAEELYRFTEALIYRTMMESPDFFGVTKEDQRHARNLGVEIPDPPQKLRLWSAENNRSLYAYQSEVRYKQRVQLRHSDILIDDRFLENPDRFVLEHAATKNGWLPKGKDEFTSYLEKANSEQGRLMSPEPKLEGYDWYDQMPQANGLDIWVKYPSKMHETYINDHRNKIKSYYWNSLRPKPYARPELPEERPDQIELRLKFEGFREGYRDWCNLACIPSDVVFETDDTNYEEAESIKPIVASGSEITIEELQKLLMCSWFEPSIDWDQDSTQRQEEEAEENYYNTAVKILEEKEAGLIKIMTNMVNQKLRFYIHQFPEEDTVVITLRRYQEPKVEVLHGQDNHPPSKGCPEASGPEARGQGSS